MKTIIQFFFKDLDPIKLESLLLPIKETTVKIHELNLDNGPHLFQITHSNLNTLFDFSKSKDYQILYFNNNKKIIGSSYTINRFNGDFLVQTQAKWVMIIPFESSLENDDINNIEKIEFIWRKDNKAEVLNKLKKEFPTTVHTNVGALYTTVSRMKAEKELNLPISWRSNSAISVKTGKRGNEMKELEWNKFYTDLCQNLKRNYPSMYDRLFS